MANVRTWTLLGSRWFEEHCMARLQRTAYEVLFVLGRWECYVENLPFNQNLGHYNDLRFY
jgi:hypothetical protein